MPAHAAYIVLFAALLHAGWNAILTRGADKLLSAVLVTTGAAVIAALALPLLPQPARASWPFIAGSVSLQALYYVLLAAAYLRADMSHGYPIMRGTAPLLVAAASAWVIGETVSQAQWLAIALICGGVLGLAVHAPAHSTRHRSATAFALVA